MLAVVLAGVAAGGIHVLSGPDHLAAIAPLAANSRGARWKAGFLWGMGHTGGVLVVGLLALLLRELLPLEAIASSSERLVGIALIGVGVWGARTASRLRVHRHEHAHDGTRHSHVHVHRQAGSDATHARTAHSHTHASFAFGILHGLAGSSHVLGVLPALALPTRALSVAYLVAYGIGNVASMTAFSAVVGAAADRARDGGLGVYQKLLYACSAAAVVVGGTWLVM